MSVPRDTVNQIRELHEAGLPVYAISKETGLARSTVRCLIGDMAARILITDELTNRQRMRLLTEWRAE